MKKLVAVSLLLFFVIVAAIFAAALMSPQDKEKTNPAPSETGKAAPVLSPEELAKHSRASDCWLLIGEKIYDVSGFIDLHPGGSETIIPYCGKEATRAFETEDKKNPQPHSLNARSLLADYYLGDLWR